MIGNLLKNKNCRNRWRFGKAIAKIKRCSFLASHGYIKFKQDTDRSSSILKFLWIFSERELKFTFAICRRPSVCLSSVCLSVTIVRPTQAIEIFGTFYSPFGTVAICWHLGKILRRSSQGNPSVRGVKHKRGNRIQRFWTYERLYLRNGAR